MEINSRENKIQTTTAQTRIFANFRDFSRIFPRFRRFFEVFPGFGVRSDPFGPIRTYSDALGCIQMRSEAFGRFRIFSEIFEHFLQIFIFWSCSRLCYIPAKPKCALSSHLVVGCCWLLLLVGCSSRKNQNRLRR